MNRNREKFWQIKNATSDTAEIYIYGEIVSDQWNDDDVTAQSFHADLKGLGNIKTLNVYINSPGGSVFEGQAIYSMLKRHPARVNVFVDGIAASIASVVAMAGDRITMPKNAMMMIHNPWTIAYGNSLELRKIADDLEKIRESLIEAYLSRPGIQLTRDQLIEIMDEETWLTAQESFDYGLIDELIEGQEIAASVSPDILARYKNVPDQFIAADLMDDGERARMLEDSKANIERINKILGV